MASAVRYAHTNIVARDWQRLARFYTEVFDCRPVGPERDLGVDWLAVATGVPDARLRGQHLLLPGHGDSGPTLEIYTYEQNADRPEPVANRVGYVHLAFEVDDVATVLDAVLAHGGQRLGEVVGTTVPGVGELRITYARDPEGNIIELQSWSQPSQE